jgi:poly(3-hydroxybutyrate) depolymerase
VLIQGIAAGLVLGATFADAIPLRSEWLEPLEGGAGFVSPPTGATVRRPIVIAIHGAGDRPDWSCSEWRAIFGPVPFIVCPQGVPLHDARQTFAWSSAAHVESAIDRAVAAVAKRWPDHVALDAPRVYAGFSQGAMLGADVVKRAPTRYPFAVFLEGLGDVAAPAFGRSLDKARRESSADGGAPGIEPRLILACSRSGCRTSRDQAQHALEKNGVEARVVDAGPIGHVVDSRVIAAVRTQVPWLLASDSAWAETKRAVNVP